MEDAVPREVGSQEQTHWWQHAVFYELYVDRFAGTFAGLTDKVPYLAELGVTCVHLLPHYPSPFVDDGYDISDYRNVRAELGTLEDFSRFVEQAHASGIHVLVDYVLNHVSSEHPWFAEARASKENDKRNFFLWSDTGTELAGATNAFPDVKPTNWIWNEATQDFYFATFYPQQPDLNWEEPRVFEEMMGIMDFWMDLGVDAFRLDAVPFLVEKQGTTSVSLPETHAVLKRIRAHVESYNPNVALLAEVHRPVEETLRYFGEADECHLVYDFPFTEALYTLLATGNRSLLDEVLRTNARLPKGCQWATFLSNHDNLHLELLDEATKNKVYAWLDPASERFFGPGTSTRLASLYNGDVDKTVEAFALLFSAPGSPVLYYGDEIGMRNAPLAEGEIDHRRVMRGTFDWDEAARQRQDPKSLYHRIRKLVAEKKMRT